MSTMSKVFLASAVAVATMAFPAAAQAASPTPVPVNLSLNIVTTVLILGVTISLALVYALSKLIPQVRRGEISLSKIEFDWRAELLNQTPKKEKERRAAEAARRAEEELVASPSCDVDGSSLHYVNTQPLVKLREGDAGATRSTCEHEQSCGTDEHVAVTVPRE